MKFITFLSVLLFTTFSFSQQQGYYVTNSGEKIQGYFKTTDFFNSNALEFATSPDAEFTPLSPDQIIEYGIDTAFKFVKHTVKIDKSDNINLKNISTIKEPQFTSETIFLNVIVEGETSLYSAVINKSARFFYSLKGRPEINQLIYKKYQTGNGVAENFAYKQQLFNDVNCKGKSVAEIVNIDYNKEHLSKYFIENNSCLGNTAVSYSNKGNKEMKLQYTVFAAAHSAKLKLEGGRFPEGSGAGESFSFGGELALVVPSERWEFFAIAEFEMLNVEASTVFVQSFNTTETTAAIETKAVNAFLGARHNFLFGKNKLFIDAAFGMSLPFDEAKISTTITPNGGEPYIGESLNNNLNNELCFNFSAGYAINNRYGLAIRYETNRNMFDNTNTGYTGNVSRIGAVLRYTF